MYGEGGVPTPNPDSDFKWWPPKRAVSILLECILVSHNCNKNLLNDNSMTNSHQIAIQPTFFPIWDILNSQPPLYSTTVTPYSSQTLSNPTPTIPPQYPHTLLDSFVCSWWSLFRGQHHFILYNSIDCVFVIFCYQQGQPQLHRVLRNFYNEQETSPEMWIADIKLSLLPARFQGPRQVHIYLQQ